MCPIFGQINEDMMMNISSDTLETHYISDVHPF